MSSEEPPGATRGGLRADVLPPATAVLLGTAMLLSASPLASADASPFRNVKVGDPAPGFALKDLEGRDFEFKPAAGKVTLLSFVDPRQTRSLDLLRDLAALHRNLSGKGIDFLAVSHYAVAAGEAKAAIAPFGVPFPVLHDGGQKAYGLYGLFIMPSTGIIGKDGRLAFDLSGHAAEYAPVVGGRARVAAGIWTEEEFRKRTAHFLPAPRTKEEIEAERLVALGRTLLEKGMRDEAGKHFEKAARLDPKNVTARLGHAEALLARKEYDAALAGFRKAREMKPDSKEALLGIGTVHLEKGELDLAIREIAEAAQLNPKPEKAYYRLGTAYERKGDLVNAAKYYRKALEKLVGS